MLRRFTYPIGTVTAFFMCLVLLITTALPIVAEGTTVSSLDFGIAERENNKTVDASELYEALLGRAPTAGEDAYLQTTGIVMVYNDLVPDSRVSTDYNGDTGVLSVSVLPYTYTAANGESVTWIPTGARIGGMDVVLTKNGDAYTGALENIWYSEDFDMEVDYEWRITVPADVVKELATSAYQTGQYAIEQTAEYDRLLSAYWEQMERHEAWKGYTEWQALDAAYQIEKEQYRLAKEAFDAYTAAYRAYEQELAVFEQWQAYFEYNNFIANHYQEYVRYKNYQAALQPITDMLALMDSLFIADSHNWQMYGSIMGSSVDQVLENEDILVNTGQANKEDIRLAGDATEALRVLLPQYAAIRNASYENEHDRIAAKLSFYTEHYDALAKHFKDLYRTLNDLFKNKVVKLYIIEQGKHDHYVQFVGQLYVFATCLDRGGDRDPNWKISDMTLSQVVESVHLFPDGDWYPGNKTMPTYAPPVEYVAPADRPDGDQVTQKPTAPTPIVSDPGDEPIAPVNPYEGNIPSETAHPGDLPKAPEFDGVTKTLMREITDGTLKKPSACFTDVTLTFASRVECLVSIHNLKTVTFYDLNGNLLHRVTVNYGESVHYAVPELEATAQYTYIPRGWASVDGTPINLAFITDDISLIPEYTKILQFYDVTFVLNGERVTTSWPYGTTPTPPSKWLLSSYEQGHYVYSFSGWDRPIETVCEDVTYVGEIIRTPKNYTVTWVLSDGVSVTEQHPALSTPVFAGSTDRAPDDYLYTFKGWLGHMGTLTGNATYRANYEATPLATGEGGRTLHVVHGDDRITVLAEEGTVDLSTLAAYAKAEQRTVTIQWNSGITLTLDADAWSELSSACRYVTLRTVSVAGGVGYRLGFFDAAWRELTTIGTDVTLKLPTTNGDAKKTVFCRVENGETVWLTDDALVLTGGIELQRYDAYSLTPIPNNLCNFLSLSPYGIAGQRVSLRLDCVWGYEVSAATVITADGRQIPVDADLTFVMPDEAVTVTFTVTEIRYTVTFIVDGVVWSYAEYALGEDILRPADPIKDPTDEYSFTFIGWGDVPAVAAGDVRDMVFEASFFPTKQNVDYSTGHNYNLFLELYVPLFLGGMALLLLLIALLLWLLVFRKRRKKRLTLSQRETDVLTDPDPIATDKTEAE